MKKQYELIFIENLKLHTTYISCNCVWLATVNACEKIHFLFLKKKESTDSTHTLLALSFFIDDNDVVVFNLSLGTSS